jgi:hypothetical protein
MDRKDIEDNANGRTEESAAGSGPTTDRRSFLKTAGVLGAVGVAGAMHGKYGGAPLSPVSAARAQESEQWWPSRWGADDEIGANNLMTPEKVLQAIRLIEDGTVHKLGRTYEAGMPTFGPRNFTMRIVGSPTGGPFGENQLVYMDEFLATEIGQVGTQFDGLGHIGLQLGAAGDHNEIRYYNGISQHELVSALGLNKLGVEKLRPFFTRGYLLNVAALVDGEMMDAGDEITLDQVREALSRQDMSEDEIEEGDAVFFNTGWGQLWMENNDRFNSGAPGIGLEVASWVVDKGVCLVGADTWPVEAVPNPDPGLAFPVHGELITKNGIYLHENLTFSDLLAAERYRFAYIYTPTPFKGATGSDGCPIAVT